MFNPSRVKLVKELYKYNNKYELCNRDICVCLLKLNMDKRVNYEYYKKCYESWYSFSKILNRS